MTFNTIRAFEAVCMSLRELEAIKFLEARSAAAPQKKEEEKKKVEQPKQDSISGTVDSLEKRWDMKGEVFKPGYILPTMSIEEFGELEKKKMISNTQ